MTRKECELALIELMEKAQAIAEQYDGKINHLSLTCLHGHYMVMGHEWDFEKSDYVRGKLLDASQFPDGEFRSWAGDANE